MHPDGEGFPVSPLCLRRKWLSVSIKSMLCRGQQTQFLAGELSETGAGLSYCKRGLWCAGDCRFGPAAVF